MAIAARVFLFLVLCAASVWSQRGYDASAARISSADQVPAVETVKAFDLGLHTAAASLWWLDVRPELPYLRQGPEHFLAGLELVNDLAPRWSAPYAFTVLVLPNIDSYEGRIPAALAVGERGLAEAEPNWLIPFYMGAIYQLHLKDHANATKYFGQAAATPGIPEIIRRFAVNYGIHPESLEATRTSWVIIRETATEETVRQRAEQHIEHLNILEKLNLALQAFKKQFGFYPDEVGDLVKRGFIAEIPADPFGFAFKIYKDKGVVGIAP